MPPNHSMEWPPAIICYKHLAMGNNGLHTSAMGLEYPLATAVVDHQAVIGSHDRCIHLYPTFESILAAAKQFQSSHIVALLVPITQYWTGGDSIGNKPTCWHTNICLPIWCHTCGNGLAEPQIVQLPNHITSDSKVRSLIEKSKQELQLVTSSHAKTQE
jgi:hypothetical protein